MEDYSRRPRRCKGRARSRVPLGLRWRGTLSGGAVGAGNADGDEQTEGSYQHSQLFYHFQSSKDAAMQPGFLNTYLELSKVLPGGSSRSHAKLSQLQVKLGAEDGAEAEKLKTSRAKLYLCFSRRWREPQLTIYLLAQDFITS